MRPLAALVLALAAVAACTSKPAEEPPAPRERPLAQDGTVARAYTSAPDRAKIQLDLAAARAAVATWRGEHGRPPGSLAELRLEGINYPNDLAYDPATGTVRSETYPAY